MEKINKSTTLLLSSFALLLVLIIAGVISFKKEISTLKKTQQSLLQENAKLKQVTITDSPQKAPVAEITVGSPCDVNNGNILNSKGLQCYFYDSLDSSGNEIFPRHGVWIKPDLRNMQIDSKLYEIYFKSWKKYVSPDKTISFSYPQNWKVDESSWKDGNLSIQSSDYSPISISKIENNAITIEQRISDDENDRPFERTIIELNGVSGTRLDIAPKDNLSDQEQIKFYFQKDKYYVELSVAKAGYAAYDFPTEYLLSTIKIK